jgi:hypothetical protein
MGKPRSDDSGVASSAVADSNDTEGDSVSTGERGETKREVTVAFVR